MDDKKQIGKPVPDEHGRVIVIYQDHDGVTLDFGLHDRNMTISQAAALMVWVGEAIGAAQLWADAQNQEQADAEA